jgi:hypothetical protein
VKLSRKADVENKEQENEEEENKVKVKGKGKVHPRTGHEGPEVE